MLHKLYKQTIIFIEQTKLNPPTRGRGAGTLGNRRFTGRAITSKFSVNPQRLQTPKIGHHICNRARRISRNICSMITTDILTDILRRVEDDEITLSYEVEGILELLNNHSKAGKIVSRWAHGKMMGTYASEVTQLVQRANGFHFTAKKTTAERLREFDIDNLASKMSVLAPSLWGLLGALLAADPKSNYKREKRSAVKAHDTSSQRTNNDVEMLDVHDLDENEDQYWNDVDERPLVGDEDDEPEDAEEQKKQRAERVALTVSVI